MLFGIFIFIHIIICVCLVVFILMQASKGKGLAGAFGGGGGVASSMLGTRGTANFLSRATTYLATAFFVISLILSLLSSVGRSSRSVVQDAIQVEGPASNLPFVPGSLEGVSTEQPLAPPFEGEETGTPITSGEEQVPDK